MSWSGLETPTPCTAGRYSSKEPCEHYLCGDLPRYSIKHCSILWCNAQVFKINFRCSLGCNLRMRNAAGFALQKPSSPGKQLPQSKVRHSVSFSTVFRDFLITFRTSAGHHLHLLLTWWLVSSTPLTACSGHICGRCGWHTLSRSFRRRYNSVAFHRSIEILFTFYYIKFGLSSTSFLWHFQSQLSAWLYHLMFTIASLLNDTSVLGSFWSSFIFFGNFLADQNFE
jgi:hypothetical protein